MSHETIYATTGSDHTPARLALAEAAVQAATRLRPDAAETHLARAQYLYYGLRDYAGALAELEIPRRALPNDPLLFELTGYILRRRGQQEEGLHNLQRAVELDPRNLSTLQQIAVTYTFLRRYAEAIAAMDRASAIMPDNAETRAARGLYYLCWKADTRPLHQTIDAILAQGPDAIVSAADSWFLCALAERDPAAAERALVALGDNPCWNEGVIALSRSFGEGLLARMTKDEARARTAFEAARARQERIVQTQPDYGPTLCVLGMIDAALGRKDLALEEGRRAIALTPLEKDVFNGSRVLQYFAITTAWAGEKELALQQLEAGLRAPAASDMLSYGALKLFPFWDSLRGDPRFEKIVAALAPKTAAMPEKSIAVLPFRNLSEDKENAFFADGIQDDLVTSLARIKDLKVVSRGSVASFRDLSGRRLRAIAQELGVGAVLEGSVRRTANRVLVNVQLTDATTERQIWSDRYDRTLKDSIALQGELAAEIATALAAKLSPEEKAQVEAKLTNNPDAYVVYLRGREFQMRPEVSRDNFVAAEQCYRHVVALDPRFALAHARLAEILQGRYEWFDHQPTLLAEARSHAEEALRLDPHCGQAHLLMAKILSWSVKSIERDKAMKQEVDSALRLVPSDGYLVMIAALFQSDMDWLAEAEATFQRAIEINPREPKVFYNYATLQAKKGDVAKARWASDRSLELAPESVYFRLFRANEEFLWTGEVARTKKFLAEIPAGKDPDGRVTAAYCTAAVYERNFPEALRLLAACPSERLPSLEGGFGSMVPKGFLEGWIHFYAGNKERAYTALDSARWILEMEAKENPGDQEAHLRVAMAYAAMGWKDAALAEIARAKDKPDGWGMAALFVHAGERDAALRLLEQLPATEREHAYYDLRLNPHWDPLRSDARFEKMLASSPSKTAR